MKFGNIIKPDFLIIGAQKCGTTWLWNMLKQHPGTDLMLKKEIHFFSTSEHYNKGKEWYYNHFNNVNPSKVVGEASTSYLYDYVTYSYNPTKALEIDHSLPAIPELITNEFPNIKIFIILRDPLRRAVSAYKFNVEKGFMSPFSGLKKTAIQRPRMRILEYGYYARYIRLWKKFIPPERMQIYVLEQDIEKFPEKTVSSAYSFLNLSTDFKPHNVEKPIQEGMGWARLFLKYYGGRLASKIINRRVISDVLDGSDNSLQRFFISEKDIDFLRSHYLSEKDELEYFIGRNIDCWTYGDKN